MFIICSSEGLETARAVQDNLASALSSAIRIDIWDQAEKRQNEFLLASLLNSASFYDYGLAILTPDDVQLGRTKGQSTTEVGIKRAPRDNVIFEAGLFLGRLGPSRSFVMLHRKAKLPSDLAGAIHTEFDAEDLTNSEQLREGTSDACRVLATQIESQEEMALFSVLPSTGLAIGYFRNFIAPVFEAFAERMDFSLESPDGRPLPEDLADVHLRLDDNGLPDMFVWLPSRLSLLEDANLKVLAGNKRRIRIKTKRRPFAFYIDLLEDSTIKLVDVPTTLVASLYAMRGLDKVPSVFTGGFLTDERQEIVERREIDNFRWTVARLARPQITWAHHVHFENFGYQDGHLVTSVSI
jgi:hypothetical protein